MPGELALQLQAVIRLHSDTGYTDIGKVVWIESRSSQPDKSKLRFWYIEFPQLHVNDESNTTDAAGKVRYYLKVPVEGLVSEAMAQVTAGSLSLLTDTREAKYLLSDDELKCKIQARDLLRKSRRDLQKWKKKRDQGMQLIAPILNRYNMSKLFDEGLLAKACRDRANELGHESADKVNHAMRRYLLNGQDENAHLPNWGRTGRPGSRKFCKLKTGRPNAAGAESFIVDEVTSNRLARGWKLHKKKGVSVNDAYIKTMSEWWAQSITWITPTNAEVKLLPPHLRPTETEFATHGPRGVPEAASARINLGENTWNRTRRPLRGSHRDGIPAVGLLGVLDATSEDQRPVSRASRLLTLPSSWRTMLVDGSLNYIFGVYRGFEHGGTLPGLMTILHGAEPHAPFARQWGFDLLLEDWYHMMFKRVRGDNGDLKSELGINALSMSQIGLEITRAYAAEHKIIETTHHTIHRTADHAMPASTRGQMATRGDEKPSESCVNFEEGWPPVIRAILRHNNEVLVPHLRTIEMGDLVPTRKNILEWCMREGYVATEATDLAYLRARCLPALQGRIRPNGIHILDPRVTEKLIPSLVYHDDWVIETGLTTRGRGVQPCTVYLNPSRIGEAWVLIAGALRQLHLRSRDPEMASLTLADWLYISDRDPLRAFLAREEQHNSDASRIISNAAVAGNALMEKRQEEERAGRKAGVKATGDKKRENMKSEREIEQKVRMGLSPPVPASAAASGLLASPPQINEEFIARAFEEDEVEGEAMTALRRRA